MCYLHNEHEHRWARPQCAFRHGPQKEPQIVGVAAGWRRGGMHRQSRHIRIRTAKKRGYGPHLGLVEDFRLFYRVQIIDRMVCSFSQDGPPFSETVKKHLII